MIWRKEKETDILYCRSDFAGIIRGLKREMNKYILALDLGTTAVKCIVFDKNGKVKGKAARTLESFYPQPGFVEQSPDSFYETSKGCVLEAILSARTIASHIEAMGISVQRETVIFWDRITGKPVTAAYSWQCSRGASYIDGLSDDEREMIRKKTGLIPSPYFSASKIAWALDNIPGLRQRAAAGEIAFGTPDSWLIYKLSGNRSHLTDYTNASRTMLFNIDTLEWDKELLELFDIPEAIFPEVKPSTGFFTETDESLFGGRIPVCGVAGDQQSALFGQRCFEPGDIKITYGTGCFILMNAGIDRPLQESGLLTTLSAAEKRGRPGYALEGSIFMCGALLKWLKDSLGIIENVKDSGKIAQSLPDNGGVYMVPALTGLGAPYWNSKARGLITGLTLDTDRRYIVRAALEGISFLSLDVLKAMEAAVGGNIRKIKTDGGVSKNDFLMNFLAGITGADVLRPKLEESTALGVAFLAGLGSGFWSSEEELSGLAFLDCRYVPDMSSEQRERLTAGWREVADKC